MNKKIKVYLSLVLCSVGILSFGSTFAQQALPAGGSSFETAVLLSPGQYQGGPLQEWQNPIYYSIQVKAGQEINAEAKYFSQSGCTVALYNEAQEELTSNYDTSPKIKWLANADKSSYKYYLRIANDASAVESFSLEVSLTNYYDANSGTDAGATFDKAVTIASGTYNGYLTGFSGIMDRVGDDWQDIYKVGLKKGITYEFKVTPPSKTSLTLSLYDSNRQLLKEEDPVNAGAIVSLFLTPSADTNIFVSVLHPEYAYQDALVNYQLEIKSSVPVIKFYACEGEYCESVGEFVSLADCQKSTTKTCYQTENCGGECGAGSTPTPAPIPGPTPPTDEGGELPPGIPLFPGIGKSFIALIWMWLVGYSIWLIILYVYFALCLQFLAKKTNTPNAWLAWIPIANIFLMLQIAQKPLWWFVLLLIPIVNIVIGILLWMKIAERRGKPSWMGILLIVPIVGIIIPGYLAFFDGFKKGEKIEITPPYTPTGTEEANKPTVGYKHPCKYCGKLIPPNSAVCPFCEKVNPLGPYRCPKCHEPIEKNWKVCPKCNQNLRIVCPFCGKITFFGDHCEDCGNRLLVKCPHCSQEQPPISDKCIKCGQSLERSNK